MKPLRTDCRNCGGRLDDVLNLGNLALSNFPHGEILTNTPIGERVPLDLCACTNCRLVQLRHTVDPDWMFRDHYWYRSGINESMQAELLDVVRQGIAHIDGIRLGDYVLDTGANDGTLLSYYRQFQDTRHVPRVAYEPASNLQLTLAPHCELRCPEYFPPASRSQRELLGHVKILTSIAMFYAVDRPHAFVKAVTELLHPEGVWIVQFQDLHQMMQATAFDNICHEHLIYYSLESFEKLIAPHGLRVVDAEVRKINGGSYRLYVMHEEEGSKPAHLLQLAEVQKIRQWETGCQDWHALERFGWRVGEVRDQLQAALVQLHDSPGAIDVYGASTKFNILAQYCGIDGTLIRQAWERSPEKVGRQTVTGIPIVSEAEGRADPPRVLLAGIWQFRESILQREAEYLAQGGTILFPLPAVDVVTQEHV